MPRKTMIEAIRDGLDMMMGRDERVVVYGEDVGYFGGVFRCTAGLQAKYGKSRCFDAPINESGIVGTAIGMAAYGLRPCVEIQFADYMYPAYDQLTQEASRLRYRSNGDFTCPIVVRMPTGGGIFGGQTHSQSPEALFTHVSGLKTVVPSNPVDARPADRGIEDPDPVIFLDRSGSTMVPSTVITIGRSRLGRSMNSPRFRTATTPCRSAKPRSATGVRRDRPSLRHDGLCRAGGGGRNRHRRRNDRLAHAPAARPRHHRGVGEKRPAAAW